MNNFLGDLVENTFKYFVLGVIASVVLIFAVGLPVVAGFILYNAMLNSSWLLLKFFVGFCSICVLGYFAAKLLERE